MYKAFTILFLLLCTCFSGLNAKDLPGSIGENSLLPQQDSINNKEYTPNKVFKFNVSGLVFKNLPFQFEYGFKNRMSVACGISIFLPRQPFSLIYPEFTDSKLSGYSITPEFRFYLKEDAYSSVPEGLYLAPYMRFNRFNVTGLADFEVYDSKTQQNYAVTIDSYYKGTGFGLMAGYQWPLSPFATLDIFILGGHFGPGSMTYSITSDAFKNLTPEEHRDVINKVTEAADRIGSDYNLQENTLKVKFPFPVFGVRTFGFAFGFLF